ncbi:MAG: hypothetical protein MZV70_51625 [Desulfobacterales bacterium]|nr:hypothetical protein [Desulfobacterales bacterium]
MAIGTAPIKSARAYYTSATVEDFNATNRPSACTRWTPCRHSIEFAKMISVLLPGPSSWETGFFPSSRKRVCKNCPGTRPT